MLAGYGIHGVDLSRLSRLTGLIGLSSVVKQDRIQTPNGLIFFVPSGTSPLDYYRFVPSVRLGDWYSEQAKAMVDTITTDTGKGELIPVTNPILNDPSKHLTIQPIINQGPTSYLAPISQSDVPNPSTPANSSTGAQTNSIQGSSGQVSNSGGATTTIQAQSNQQTSSPSYYAYNPTAGSVISQSSNPATATSGGGIESTLIGMLQGSGIDFSSIGNFFQSKLFGVVPVWLVGGAGVGYFMFRNRSSIGAYSGRTRR